MEVGHQTLGEQPGPFEFVLALRDERAYRDVRRSGHEPGRIPRSTAEQPGPLQPGDRVPRTGDADVRPHGEFGERRAGSSEQLAVKLLVERRYADDGELAEDLAVIDTASTSYGHCRQNATRGPRGRTG